MDLLKPKMAKKYKNPVKREEVETFPKVLGIKLMTWHQPNMASKQLKVFPEASSGFKTLMVSSKGLKATQEAKTKASV